LPLVLLAACAGQALPSAPASTRPTAPPTAPQTAPATGTSDIDHLYLDAVGAVDRSGRLDTGTLQQLIDRLEAPGMEQASDDTCVHVKRRQMLPILFSLAIIDGLADGQRRQEMRLHARSDLVALSTAHPDAAYEEACNGRGFPAVTGAEDSVAKKPAG
jgi:hypothetical protein